MVPIALHKEIRKLEKYIGIRKYNKGDRYLNDEILIYKVEIKQNPQKYFRWLMSEYSITSVENEEMVTGERWTHFKDIEEMLYSDELIELKKLPVVDWRDKL